MNRKHLANMILAATLLLSAKACTDTALVQDEYLGTYTASLTHITGIYPLYDDMGNPLGDGYDTIRYIQHAFSIEKDSESDSLNVTGLYNNYPERSDLIKGVVHEDTLHLFRQQDDIISKDNVRGYIFLSQDSLYINYRWDKTNTWATNAIPHYGMITGSAAQ